MLLKDNKKNLVTIITKKIGGEFKDESTPSPDKSSEDYMLKNCGEEILSAIMLKEPIKLAKALKKLLAKPEEESESEESESDYES